jgi:hypothetical protein
MGILTATVIVMIMDIITTITAMTTGIPIHMVTATPTIMITAPQKKPANNRTETGPEGRGYV